MNVRHHLPKLLLVASLVIAFAPAYQVRADAQSAHPASSQFPSGSAVADLGPAAPQAAVADLNPILSSPIAGPAFAQPKLYKITTEIATQTLITYPIGTPPVVTARLMTDAGNPIPNRMIRVFAYKNRVAQGITDATGTVQIPLHFNFFPGDYELLVVFNGSQTDNLLPCQVLTRLTMIPGQLEVNTVPAMAGVQFKFNDQVQTTNANGVAVFEVDHIGGYHIEVMPITLPGNSNMQVNFDRWNNNDVSTYHAFQYPVHRALQAGFLISYPVKLQYTDKGNQPVDPARISTIKIRTAGTFYTLKDPTNSWLPTNSILHRVGGFLESKPATYYLDTVTIAGANVVNQGEQRFQVDPNSTWWIKLFLYSARFRAHDALLGTPIGSGILLEYPDGAHTALTFDPFSQIIKLESLPRGIYHASVTGTQGLEPRIPLSLSRGRDFDLLVVSRIDLAILFGVPALVALLFLVFGRTPLLDKFGARRRAAA